MAEIRLKENESLDSALRRFKKQCARAPLSSVRKSQKQLASASINKAAHIYLESGRFARFFVSKSEGIPWGFSGRRL